MNPDIGTSQRCLKGQVTPEHQGLGTGVRQQWDNSGVLHWFLRLQHSPSPNLVLDVLVGGGFDMVCPSVFQHTPISLSSQPASPYHPHPVTLRSRSNIEG